MYDFSNDAIDAEHADVTFKSMEDGFPTIRDQLREVNFGSWRHDLPFLRSYMEMIRVRSPLYFEEQGQAVADSFLGRVVTVDEGGRKIVYDNSHPLPRMKFTITPWSRCGGIRKGLPGWRTSTGRSEPLSILVTR